LDKKQFNGGEKGALFDVNHVGRDYTKDYADRKSQGGGEPSGLGTKSSTGDLTNKGSADTATEEDMPNERYPGAAVRDGYHALILANRSLTQIAVWISFDNEWWATPNLPSRANSLVIPGLCPAGQLLGITSSTTPTTVSRVRRSHSMKTSFAGKGSSSAHTLCWAQRWYSRFFRFHRFSQYRLLALVSEPFQRRP
jgi:hypothetical protein